MGSGTGSTGNPEHATGQGRHRRGETALALPPPSTPTGGTQPLADNTMTNWWARGSAAVRRTARHARPEADAAPVRPATRQPKGGVLGGGAPPADPLTDSGTVGLRMFNLGTIPASVTPPRSWRRAAWFTVAASVAALAGLLAVAAVMVGPAQHGGKPNALPYFPDGAPLATIDCGVSDTTQVRHRPPPLGPTQPVTNEVVDVHGPLPLTSATSQGPDPVAVPSGQRTTSVVGGPMSLGTVPPVDDTPPPATTVSAAPLVDPTGLLTRTKSFFDDVTAVIQRKYGDQSSIQIQSMSLDPTSGLTVSALRVVNKGGRITMQHIKLQFTLSGDPKIINPGG
jgi:hypothetical protein